MHKTTSYLITIALLAAAFASTAYRTRAAEEAASAEAKQRQLILLLESDAPRSEKAIACKQLAVYGTREAVPALATLLSDRELASWARIALEAIPDLAADEVLREATKNLNGRLLIGAINSIGVRRDSQAVAGLAQRLQDADDLVASAAAVALGRIGNGPAAKTLRPALVDARETVRSAVAEGCILCAERLLDDGKLKKAAKLYDQVRQADVPKQRVIEATRGSILARRGRGIPLLVEQLRADDKQLVAIGLSAARELPGRKVTAALVAELKTATAERQAQLLFALADRNDATALPALIQAAKTGPKYVRLVAVQSLRRVGDVSCVPALLDAAVEADSELQEAAMTTLAGLADDEVDAYLVARLPEVDQPLRKALIELAGRRRVAAANPLLLRAVDDSDADTRAAALTALGATVGPDRLSVLIARVLSADHNEDREVALAALHAASIRMPDRETCGEQLAAAMPSATASAQSALVEILGSVGGANALRTIAAAGQDDNPELQDVASRVLGEWMTADAAPVLLEMACGQADAKYQVRALRGYLRIARQFDLPTEQRAEMCRAALKAAKRDAEKELVLEVLQRYPSAETIGVAVEAVQHAGVRTAAVEALLAMAPKVDDQAVNLQELLAQGGQDLDLQELLAQVGQDLVKVEIIKAEYGAGGKSKNVTELLRKHVRGAPLVELPSSNYNAAFGGDPAPGVPKKLTVEYKIDDKRGEVSLPENAAVLLPIPGNRS